MAELINPERLHPEIQQLVAQYAKEMIKLHEENLKSIVVYGSAAGEQYIPKKSNINLILVFNSLAFSALKKSLKAIAAGRKKKILAPLFLTERHILSSCDVFPIEFLDIKENHLTIYGYSVFHDLKIDQANLRLQCEQEIKGKLIRLRQSYLETGLEKNELEGLLSQSLNALMPVFRTIIRLKGKFPSTDRETLIHEVSEDLELQEDIFLAVLNIKRGHLSLNKTDLENLIEDYFNALEQLAQKIDQF